MALSQGLDLSTPIGRLQAQTLAVFAEFEVEMIRRRTVEGLAAARARGRRLGRPAREVDVAAALALRRHGLPWRKVAAELGVPEVTVRRACAKIPPSADSVPVAS